LDTISFLHGACDLAGRFLNPFKPETIIFFDVPETAHVTVEVKDAQGHEITTLVDGTLTAGRHEVQWTGLDQAGRRVSSGVYLCIVKSEDLTTKCELVLLK
jgi:flagellar hook assembly protein FlgD